MTCRPARHACRGLRAQLLVVDSGSADDTADRIEREWPDDTVLRGPNVGFAAGTNRGRRRARGRYVLLLNPDVEIVAGTISQLARGRGQQPAVGVGGLDWCRRMHRYGWDVRHLPDVTIVHHQGATTGRSSPPMPCASRSWPGAPDAGPAFVASGVPSR